MSAWLFVPGTRPGRFAKAHAAGARAVILDLEDAVAAADKDHARRQVAQAVGAPAAAGDEADAGSPPPSWVRVNGAGSPWFAADLDALAGARALAGVLLPKAEHGHDVELIRNRLGVAVVPLVESALGLRNRDELACADGVTTLAFGSIDYALDLGAVPESMACSFARWQIVEAARLAGVEAPIDGVTADFSDDDLVSEQARVARAEGCGGKLCIHPRQVPLVVAAFAPTAEELAWAERLVAACGDGRAVALDGQMLDAPVVARARQLLERRTDR